MNELELYKLDQSECRQHFDSLQPGELAALLKGMRERTVQYIIVMAQGVASLDARNYPMDTLEFKPSELDFLRRLGSGEIDTELYKRYQYERRLLNSLSGLALAVQQQIVRGEPFKVATGAGDDHIMKMPEDMTPEERARVFVRSRDGKKLVASVPEQVKAIERERRAARVHPERIGKLEIDRETDSVKFLGKRGDYISGTDIRAVAKMLANRRF